MSNRRLNAINETFQKVDRTGDGVITVDDLRGVYNFKRHPKYLNGEWTEDECIRQFLDQFDSEEKDGKITKGEFKDYYTGVSAAIGSARRFIGLLKTDWKQ